MKLKAFGDEAGIGSLVAHANDWQVRWVSIIV
jgi:hypothetical protein